MSTDRMAVLKVWPKFQSVHVLKSEELALDKCYPLLCRKSAEASYAYLLEKGSLADFIKYLGDRDERERALNLYDTYAAYNIPFPLDTVSIIDSSGELNFPRIKDLAQLLRTLIALPKDNFYAVWIENIDLREGAVLRRDILQQFIYLQMFVPVVNTAEPQAGENVFLPCVDGGEIELAVLGTKKAGKSTLINALLGDVYTPMSVEIPTPNNVYYYPLEKGTSEIELKYENQTKIFSSAEKLKNHLEKNFRDANDRSATMTDMKVYLRRFPSLLSDLRLVDTPGPNFAGASGHRKAAEYALKNARQGLFVMNYSSHLTDDEVKFFDRIYQNFEADNRTEPLLIAVNRIDEMYNAEEVKSSVRFADYVRRRLNELGYTNILVVTVSSLLEVCRKKIAPLISENGNLRDELDRLSAENFSGDVCTAVDVVETAVKRAKSFFRIRIKKLDELERFSGISNLVRFMQHTMSGKMIVKIDDNKQSYSAQKVGSSVETPQGKIAVEHSKCQIWAKDGTGIYDLEDLKRYINPDQLVEIFRNGTLHAWLERNFFLKEANAIIDIPISSKDILPQLERILFSGVNIETRRFDRRKTQNASPSAEHESIMPTKQEIPSDETLTSNEGKLFRIKAYTNIRLLWDKSNQTAFNQKDLDWLIRDGHREIILCDNTFRIPIKKRHVHYLGLGNALLDLQSISPEEFGRNDITFVNASVDGADFNLTSDVAQKCLSQAFEAAENNNYERAFAFFQAAAQNGSLEATYYLAYCYAYGEGVNRDEKKALEYFACAASSGDADAMCRIGEMYAYGNNVEQDVDLAIYWLKKSRDNGCADAFDCLGDVYRFGIGGVSKDPVEAVSYYKGGANKGSISAKNSLGEMYFYGEGAGKNERKAARLFEQAAQAGNSTAMRNLAICYRDGSGVECDLKKSFKWFENAVRNDDEIAAILLGDMYLYGNGVAQNPNTARHYYEHVAEKGLNFNLRIDAMKRLGDMYFYEESLPDKNHKLALHWYKSAAEQGDSYAMDTIGEIYQVEGKYRKANEWFTKAMIADESNHWALYHLGIMLHDGKGVPVDYSEAYRLLQRSAELGNDYAMLKIGNMYRNGDGVRRDFSKARYWYERATEFGNEAAKDALQALK